MQQEYENLLDEERSKTEDIKKKFYKEQSQMDAQLDKVQSGMESLRQENLALSQAKSESIRKQRELQEQLALANE